MLSVSTFNQSISPAWSHPHMTMMKNVGPLWQRTCQSAPQSSSRRSFLLWQVVRIVQRIFQCSLNWKTLQVMLSTPQGKSGKSYSGKNVLVVGSGNSGMEIAYDLATHGANTSIVIRSPVRTCTIYFHWMHERKLLV